MVLWLNYTNNIFFLKSCWVTSEGFVLGCSDRCTLSHGVVKHHVLFGQLQQHRIVEELADAYILAQTLQWEKKKKSTRCQVTHKSEITLQLKTVWYPSSRCDPHLASSGLDHELSGQMGGGLRLKRPDHNTFIQGVTRYNLGGNVERTLRQVRRKRSVIQNNMIQ